MCVLTDCQVSQNLDRLTNRRQPVVTRKRNIHVITDTLNPHHDMRRQGFDQGAFEKCDHVPQTDNRLRANDDLGIAIFAVLILAFATRASGAEESAWRVWLEARFLRAPITAPVPNAQKTDYAGGALVDGELENLSKADFGKLGVEWKDFSARARENAAADLAILKPRFERDSRKTIIYAALESERPIVASAVLAPRFLDLWKDTLGEKVLVVVPNRFTAYVFPRIASDYQSYYPMVLRAYRATVHPVSVEVFEVSSDGWKSVGSYEEP